MIVYADASVVLRVVLGSPDRLAGWPQVDEVVASELLRTECRRSLHRLRASNRIDDAILVEATEAAQRLWSEARLVAVNSAVLFRAGDPFPTPLGTLDAIHLATALLWERDSGQPVDAFLTHDVELGRAARTMGLRVLGC